MLRLRIGALIAAGAIAFAACSGASTAAPSVAQPSTPAASSGTGASTAPSTAPSGPTPVNGGTWIFGSASDPTTLDAILIQDGESLPDRPADLRDPHQAQAGLHVRPAAGPRQELRTRAPTA